MNIVDRENPWGIKVAEKVKTFDRAAHRFGHSPNESTIRFPNVFNQGHDEDHRSHPLHKIAQKYGFEYSHTTPVTQHDGSVLPHHTWHNSAGHQIGAYLGKTEWSSKTSAGSGHVWTGIGTIALDKHLRSKAKRYKLQNNESRLPTTPILESLLDSEPINKVQRYADFMNKKPATTFGYQINEISQADELRKTWKMKEEAEKKFGAGRDQADWGLFDYRSGKPK